MDFTRTRYETFEELRLYCYRVASVVGLMMVHVFGYTDEKAFYHAEQLGLAMQLTKSCEMWGKTGSGDGCTFLRRSCDTLAAAKPSWYTPAYQALMAFQVERARAFYREGLEGLKYLPSLPARLTVRMMGSLYAGILDRLEAEGFPNLHKRVYVPLSRKGLLAARQTALELRDRLQLVSQRQAPRGVVGLVGLTAAALVSLHTGLFSEWRWMDSLYLLLWEAIMLGIALQTRGSLCTFAAGALVGGVAEMEPSGKGPRGSAARYGHGCSARAFCHDWSGLLGLDRRYYPLEQLPWLGLSQRGDSRLPAFPAAA